MSKVIFISEIQANALRGVKFDKDSFFNPVKDKNGNWCISVEEVNFAKSVFVGSKIANLSTMKSTVNQTAVDYEPPVWDIFTKSEEIIKGK